MKSKTKRWDFDIFNIGFAIAFAAPKTVWQYSIATHSRSRIDFLFGLTRLYSRKYKSYLFQIHFWRLMILMYRIRNKKGCAKKTNKPSS